METDIHVGKQVRVLADVFQTCWIRHSGRWRAGERVSFALEVMGEGGGGWVKGSGIFERTADGVAGNIGVRREEERELAVSF